MTKPMDPTQWDKIKSKGVLEEDDTLGATDWEMRYKKGTDSEYSNI